MARLPTRLLPRFLLISMALHLILLAGLTRPAREQNQMQRHRDQQKTRQQAGREAGHDQKFLPSDNDRLLSGSG